MTIPVVLKNVKPVDYIMPKGGRDASENRTEEGFGGECQRNDCQGNKKLGMLLSHGLTLIEHGLQRAKNQLFS